jgi:hypothetical protein
MMCRVGTPITSHLLSVQPIPWAYRNQGGSSGAS